MMEVIMRLVTRGDLDGVISAVLLSEMEEVDSIELIHSQAATLGHNIFTRDCKTNIGQLCSLYGGGGHRGACVLESGAADGRIAEIVKELKKNG